MRAGIHPEYEKALITCACGRVTETRSTVGEIHVEICSHCHPFFTGRQKLVDTAGRVERFIAKYGREDQPSPDAAVAEAEGGVEESETAEPAPEAPSAGAEASAESEASSEELPEAEEEAAAVDS